MIKAARTGRAAPFWRMIEKDYQLMLQLCLQSKRSRE